MGLLRIDEILKGMLRNSKNPETESPIEDYFMNQIVGMLADEVKLIPQYEVSAMGMNFRIDFVIQLKEKIVAVECDGKEFHNPARDLWRDAVLLGENKIDVMYRFTGKDLRARVRKCVYIIYFHEKDLFSKYASDHINLSLGNDFLRQQPAMLKEEMVIYGSGHATREGVDNNLYATRRTKTTPKALNIYNHCQGLIATSIEDLTRQVKKKFNIKTK